MQMMPKINWPQRVASDAVARDEIASDVLVATASSIPALLIEQHACPRTLNLRARSHPRADVSISFLQRRFCTTV
jgi:hypothetical protein